jgi:hypothetical protein
MLDVPARSGEKIIDAEHLAAGFEQFFAQMRA